MSVLPKSFSLKDGSELIVREATSEDAADLIEMVKRIFSNAEFALTKPEEYNLSKADQATRLETFQSTVGSIYLLAQHNEQLVGDIVFANGKKQRNQHQGEMAMGVLPEFRKLGVGNALLETLIEWAEKDSLVKKMKLNVAIQNYNAIHLYRNHGFIEEGRLIKEIKTDDGEYMDVLAMYKFV
ncbi:MAG: N-acetyltransferase family protein [Saprospiraceae bacterium]